MTQRNSVSRSRWSLAAAFLFLFLAGMSPLPAAAQTVSFAVTTNSSVPLATTGLSELLGSITLTGTAACGTTSDGLCFSVASTLQVTFTNVTIDNAVGSGIQVCESVGGSLVCNAAGTFMNGSFTIAGGTLQIGVRANADIAQGDQITIQGVRARIAGSALATPGVDANVAFSSTPSSAVSVSSGTFTVGQSADPLSIRIFSVPAIPCVFGDPIPTVQIVEGYPAAFVDYGDPAERSFPGPPQAARPAFGANSNTRIGVTLSGLVPGIQVEWPPTVQAQTGSSTLDLISTSADSSSAVYIYGTPDQGKADQVAEIFPIRLNPINFRFSGTGDLSGIVSLQTQLLPPPMPDTIRPRYDHPLEPVPAEPFFLLQRCTATSTTVGTVTVHADVDGLPWSGTLNYQLQGPVLFDGSQAPDTIANVPVGDYNMIRLSGGPAGATFTGISPFHAQTVTASATIDFLFDFTGPTIANLQLSSTSLPVCPSAATQVGGFQLMNATSDAQIIPAHTALTISYSKLLVTPPIVTGLGNIQGIVGASDVTYVLPSAITLPPGGAISFSGAVLNLNGVANGQAITAMVTAAPVASLQLNVNQVTVASGSTAQCVPVLSLNVQPSSIIRGQTSTLSWTSQFATSLNIQPGIGAVQAQGSQSVSPNDTTTYTLTAQGLGGPAQATATLSVNPPPPSFTSAGVTNGASFVAGVTAGAITTLFGTHLSNLSGINLTSGLPLQTQLLGTSLTINAIPAPLFAVDNVNGQEQINFQAPWEIAQQSTATIVVNNNGVLSDPVTLNVQTALPGVFTSDGTKGAILHGIGLAPVTQANPAATGETVVVFATGLGPVSNTPSTGAAAGSNPTSESPVKPIVTVGGVSATVDFSGLAPGFVGLFQVNIELAPNTPSGSQDVVIQIGNQSSKPVKISIR